MKEESCVFWVGISVSLRECAFWRRKMDAKWACIFLYKVRAFFCSVLGRCFLVNFRRVFLIFLWRFRRVILLTGFSSKFRWQNADQGHFDTAKVTLYGVLLCLVLGSGGFLGWVFFLSIFSRRFFVCWHSQSNPFFVCWFYGSVRRVGYFVLDFERWQRVGNGVPNGHYRDS